MVIPVLVTNAAGATYYFGPERVASCYGRFGNAARRVLDCIGNGEAEMLSFSKKSLKAGEIFRGGDDENIADIRLHENGERIVDQGFVVDREELFRCGLRHGIETAAFASCKDDPLHVLSSKV